MLCAPRDHRDIAGQHTVGVLQQMDLGSLGRTGWEDKEREVAFE